MTQSVIVAKVPTTYDHKKIKELESSIRIAVNETRVLVVPEEVEVMVMHIEN